MVFLHGRFGEFHCDAQLERLSTFFPSQVEVLVGKDKGKIGTVNYIVQVSETCFKFSIINS